MPADSRNFLVIRLKYPYIRARKTTDERPDVERLNKSLFWTIILSEATHIFCCVLPTLFSLLSLLVGAGLIASLPPGWTSFHTLLHDYEVPLIVFSGAVIALGWAADWYAGRIDCHDTGCGHPPCKPVKRRAHIVLKIASALFIVNLIIYFVFHRGLGVMDIHA